MVPGGKGPYTPVGSACTPICGVKTALAEAQRSNPELPGVALTRSAMRKDFSVEGTGHSLYWGTVPAVPWSLLHTLRFWGPGAGPSASFPAVD